jgi:phosphatidylinositol alpha-1,6-mannosyltransferase
VYLVVGAGPEREAIEAAIARADLGDHVRLLGRVPQSALNAVYSRADVFVMPNVPVEGDVEGFGIAALEASSTGTPVVAADVDGISDAVRAGNGILVPAKDAVAFAKAVLATDSSPRARKAIRAFTLAEFSWEKIALTLNGLLDEVVREVVDQVARGRAR